MTLSEFKNGLARRRAILIRVGEIWEPMKKMPERKDEWFESVK